MKRRIILLAGLLALGSSVEAVSLDLVESQLDLTIDHRPYGKTQAYLEGQDLYLEGQDLAKGLGFDLKLGEDRLDIKTNKPLGDPKDQQVFYENQAKKRRLYGENLKDLKGESLSLNIERKPRVYLNGEELDLKNLIIDGKTYLNVLDLGQALRLRPNLEGRSLSLDGAYLPPVLMDLEAIRLDELLKEKERQEVLEGLGLKYEKIKTRPQLEAYLAREFGKLEKNGRSYRFDLDLEGGGKSYKLDLDLRDRTRDLTRSDLRGLVWRIYSAMEAVLDQDIDLEGRINLAYGDRVYFWSNPRAIDFDFSKTRLERDPRPEENDLRPQLERVLDRYFRNYDLDISISAYDIYLDLEDKAYDYEDLSAYRKARLFEDLSLSLERLYPGLRTRLKIADGKKTQLVELGEESWSQDLGQDLVDFLNTRYSSLGRIKVDYGLSQGERIQLNGYLKAYEGQTEDLESLGRDLEDYLASVLRRDLRISFYNDEGKRVYDRIYDHMRVGPIEASQVSGPVEKGTKISLSSSSYGVKIYYTLDGSQPNRESKLYTGPIEIQEDTIIKAFGVSPGLKDSRLSVFTYRPYIKEEK